MTELSPRDLELVAIGAAIASNCIPCVEHHIPLARQAGLTDAQVRAAVEYADKVRKVPAARVLEVALHLVAGASTEDQPRCAKSGSCC